MASGAPKSGNYLRFSSLINDSLVVHRTYTEPMMPERSESVSARLSKEVLTKLDRAREAFHDSRGDYMRRVVIDKLYHQDTERLATAIDKHSEKLERLDSAITELRISSSVQEERLNSLCDSLRKILFLLLTLDGPLPPGDARELCQDLITEDEG